jgi:hypothetical protein
MKGDTVGVSGGTKESSWLLMVISESQMVLKIDVLVGDDHTHGRSEVVLWSILIRHWCAGSAPPGFRIQQNG